MPRRYSMQTRSKAVEGTRQRIVDATVELHNEQGVSGTSMQDVADRADVALATVYRHFPSLDDLVPACGGRNLELNPPPTAAVVEGVETVDDRVAALVRALHAHYERGVRPYEVGFAEAVTLPVMARLMDEMAAYLERLAAVTLEPCKPTRQQLAAVAGLCDFRVWRALTQAGLTSAQATELVRQLISTAVAPSGGVEGG